MATSVWRTLCRGRGFRCIRINGLGDLGQRGGLYARLEIGLEVWNHARQRLGAELERRQQLCEIEGLVQRRLPQIGRDRC